MIGIIGGSGPEAGVDLFTKVLAEHRRRIGDCYTGDRDAPDMILFNVSALGGPRTEADVEPGSPARAASWRALEGAVKNALASCDIFGIACNTLHVFAREVAALCGDRKSAFVSIVDATIDRLPPSGGGAPGVAILGGPATTGPNSPYRVATAPLAETERERLQKIIWDVKRTGPSAASRAAFAGLVETLRGRGIETLVLACTELPLVADPGATALLDPTMALAAALLDAAAAPAGS